MKQKTRKQRYQEIISTDDKELNSCVIELAENYLQEQQARICCDAPNIFDFSRNQYSFVLNLSWSENYVEEKWK
ncbi:hypothetical protein BH20ACI1_BH20ACI1_01150 [soil metagenome]